MNLHEEGTLKELNLEVGDVVESCDPQNHNSWYFKYCNRYTIEEEGRITDDRGGDWNQELPLHTFRVISRAKDAKVENTKELKTWGRLSDEEQGALLLAHHKGEVIEWAYGPCDTFDRSTLDYGLHPECDPSVVYRVKREPVVETIELFLSDTFCTSLDEYPGDTHKITFDVIDGEVDVNSVNMEKL